MDIQFNPGQKKGTLTYAECLEPAMTITEQHNADQYIKDYVAYIEEQLIQDPRTDNKTALDIAKINIGYWTGYCDYETQQRVKKLFKCKHPLDY
jgi:hypothetical protein